MGRIRRGWEITKQSLHIIRLDKEILLFPIVQTLFVLIFSTVFISLAFFANLGEVLTGVEAFNYLLMAILLVYLFFMYFLGIFFQSAIITSASIRLNGDNPRFLDGMKYPFKKIFKLFGWTLITMVVGIILNFISNFGKGKSRSAENASKAGSSVLGFSWNLLTIFTIPVILFENEGLFGAIGRSGRLFKETWGENLSSKFSTALVFFLFIVVGVIPLVLLLLTGVKVLMVFGIIFFFVYIGFILILSTCVKGILIAALYYYANTRNDPQIFNQEVMSNLFG